ncbi:hypothetical protein OIV83_002833 [Microbotryomycetes sp. JL201]|nr:hypothetical protein OIV83_002833 [Microbotryomycetes sp. JL201]
MFKTVELATKPKRAPPKAKYIDPIIQATFNNDGSLQEIVKAISTRLRDTNTTVVFKALIVCHQILRAGSLENTFSYLASSSLPQQLMQQDAPNLHAYGMYLAARIKSYNNIKRDVIRDKSDRRASSRLRNLSVEKGLLRETREVQRMIAALVESKFYSDDVDDQVSMTALRFLVKDLLVLFTAVNEGVINVLEHYFEMSHVDATTALKIYKTFCRDTEKVVAYLGIAKKLQNVTNIPIPNLKHAPVSLAKSLEEYLNDPNFEKNREEYQENKRIADGLPPKARKESETKSQETTTGGTASLVNANGNRQAPQSFTDFFESIEQSQTSMFDPSTNAPTLSYFHQQAAFNPFLPGQTTGLPMVPQITGMPSFPGQPSPFGPFPIMSQPTGFMPPVSMPGPSPFLQPQMTGTVNPFRQSMMMTGMQPPSASPFSVPPMPSVPQQASGVSVGGPFGQGSAPMQTQPTGAFASAHPGSPFAPPQQQLNGSSSAPIGQHSASPFSTGVSSAFAPPGRVTSPSNASVPPSTAPAMSAPFSQPATTSATQSLVPQKTGARNPFAPAPGTVLPHTVPEQPKAPSMNALAQQAFGQQQQQMQEQQAQQQQQASQDHFSSIFARSDANQAAQPLTQTKTGMMGNIASEFALGSGTSSSAPSGSVSAGGPAQSQTSLGPFGQSTPSQPDISHHFSNLSISTNPSGPSTNPSGPFPFSSALLGGSTSGVSSPLTPQRTGFAGSSVKPFQPTSDFGAKLAGEFDSSDLGSSSAFGNSGSHGFGQQLSTTFNSSSAVASGGSTTASAGNVAGFNPFRATSPTQPFSSQTHQQQQQQTMPPQQVPMRTGTVLPPLNARLGGGTRSMTPGSTIQNIQFGDGPSSSVVGPNTNFGPSTTNHAGASSSGNGMAGWATFGGPSNTNDNAKSASLI